MPTELNIADWDRVDSINTCKKTLETCMSNPRKIRWLIAHHPQELFVRTAQAFAQELNKHCPGELEVEILTYPEYRERYQAIAGLEILNQKDVALEEGIQAFWQALEQSDIEMSQVQVSIVGDRYSDFHALDLPFLFDDHDHATRVLEGDIGKMLCQNLAQRSDVRGLAFTYSGGYRVIGSNQAINGVEDLQGLRIVVQNPNTLGSTIESMGGQAVVIPPNLWNKHDVFGEDKDQAVETTYLRFDGNHVLKTNHSMFLTTILVSNKFWSSLTDHQRQAFEKAAHSAARQERQWSIEDAAKYEAEAAGKDITIVDISEQDRQTLKHKSQMTYVKFKHFFSDGLVHKIRTCH